MKYCSCVCCEKVEILYSWNSFSIAETPNDGRLGPKHVVKGRSDRNSCIFDGIVLCIEDILMQ
jgi:hypothetical protein